jgi:predicted nucleic acid-binding protein
MTQGVIVADAGPLIALAVGAVLPQSVTMLGGLLVPQSVLDECVADITAAGAATINALLQSAALTIIAHGDIAPLDEAFARGLGSGEAAVLSYANAHGHTALIDERRARRIAAKIQVPVIGTGAVVVALKTQGRIHSVLPVLAAWKSHGYFLSEAVTTEILRRAQETPSPAS